MEKIGMQAVLEDKQFQDGAKRYTATTNQMVATTDQASSKITKTSSSMYDLANAAGVGGGAVNALNTAMQGAALVGGVMLAKQLATTVWELGKAGAQTLRMRESFAELSRQAGGSGDDILAAVKRATDGTVSGGNIIASVNRGILLGLGANADQWEKLAEVARFRSRAMGLDMTQALNDIAMGIGRESRLILDNLGIILDLDKVTGEYAATLGKTADQLTASERKQAILNSVITEGQKQIQAAGGITEDATDKFAQLDVTLGQLNTTLGTLAAGPAAEAAEMINKSIQYAIILFPNFLEAYTEAKRLMIDTEPERKASAEFSVLGFAISQVTKEMDKLAADTQQKLAPGIQAGTDRLTAMAVAYAGLDAAQAKFDTAISRAAEKAVDAEEKAADQRLRARENLMDALESEERSHASKVEDILQELADVDASLQQEMVEAQAEADQERVELAQQMAEEIADAERELQQEIADLQRENRYDEEDAQREFYQDMADLEREYQQDMADIQAEYDQQMADLTEAQQSEEADIRAKYKEARIQELVAMGGDEETIRATWTDDMLQGPLKEAQDAELAALAEKYGAEAAQLAEELEREKAEREQAYQERKAELQREFDEEREQRQIEYERKLEDLRIQHQRELEEIQRRNAEELAALEQRLAEEKVQMEAAADEQRRQLQAQLAEEEANHLEREAELQRHYDQQMAEISRGLAAQLADIQRNLGLELNEIAQNSKDTTQAWKDGFTQQLLDQDQYYVDRLARDAQYQADYEALFGIQSPSKWMAEMGQQLRAGLDIGLTTPAMDMGGGGGVTNNRTVNLSMPTTVNNGMDAAMFQASVLRTVQQAVRYG